MEYVILAVVVIFLVDRCALFLEARGHIYWRKRKGSASALGNAFLEAQSMVDPGAKQVLEMRLGEVEEHADSGDPPHPEDEG